MVRRINFDLVVLIFIAFYAPPLIPNLNLTWLVVAYAIVKLLLSGKRLQTYFRSSGASLLFMGLILYCIVWALSMAVNIMLGGDRYWGNYITSAYSLVLFIPAAAAIALYFSMECIDRKLDVSDVFKILIVAGLIESGLTIAAFVSPAIRETFVSIMRQNTGDAIYNNWATVEWRFYGFANSMLDLFGVGTGVIAALPCYLSLIPGNRKWIIATIPLFVVPLLNSRTGILLFGVMFCGFLLLLLRKNAANILAIPLVIAFVVVLVLVSLAIVSEFAPATAGWITMDITSFLESGDTVTGRLLFSKSFWELPEGPLVLTGTGHTKYLVEGFSHSDVGYINQIWRAGIIGSIIMYGTLAISVRYAERNTKLLKDGYSQCASGFLLAAFICLLIGQIKCDCFVYTAASVALFSICFFVNASAQNNNSIDESIPKEGASDHVRFPERLGHASPTTH